MMILTENSHLCIRLSIEAVLNHLRATKHFIWVETCQEKVYGKSVHIFGWFKEESVPPDIFTWKHHVLRPVLFIWGCIFSHELFKVHPFWRMWWS